MKAVTWHGNHDVRVATVPDPALEHPTDAIVRVTSTGICGSDLHLYEVLGSYIDPGDILGHEPMGIVEEVGSETGDLKVGDRVVVPFNISCGHCWMCDQGLMSQCETTQNHEYGTGASFFGYTKLYGQVPGGQAEFLRVPQAQFGPIKVPEGPPDDRFVYLSDVLPTAWQAVQYADPPKGGSLVVLGLGPIGDMCTRIARHRGVEQVIGVDLVPERLARARRSSRRGQRRTGTSRHARKRGVFRRHTRPRVGPGSAPLQNTGAQHACPGGGESSGAKAFWRGPAPHDPSSLQVPERIDPLAALADKYLGRSAPSRRALTIGACSNIRKQ